MPSLIVDHYFKIQIITRNKYFASKYFFFRYTTGRSVYEEKVTTKEFQIKFEGRKR